MNALSGFGVHQGCNRIPNIFGSRIPLASSYIPGVHGHSGVGNTLRQSQLRDWDLNEPENRGGKSRFICQLTVPGINYVGLGNSTSKKDSQANAARDFGLFLVREGFINASEIPQLQIQIIEESDIQVVGGDSQK
uniref:DRBM domain-containing protein n=1 Tax=Globodera pallida TaxID=36090 RepID=A0A183BNC8_GLOPA